jgi:hypothetical protein
MIIKIIAIKNKLFFLIMGFIFFSLGITLSISMGFQENDMFPFILGLAFGIAFFLVGTINLPCVKINYNSGLINYNAIPWGDKNKDNIDRWNWEVRISEIKIVEVVYLTKEEKYKFTSGKFFFNKFLSITLNNDKKKYFYISLFSNKQIKKIVRLLNSK